MKIKSEDFHKELARDMGASEKDIDELSRYIEDILWRMNDDPKLPKPKEFDIPDGEKITFKSIWKTLTNTQKRHLIKDARGENPESPFLNLLIMDSGKHRKILPLFIKSVPSFKNEKV